MQTNFKKPNLFALFLFCLLLGCKKETVEVIKTVEVVKEVPPKSIFVYKDSIAHIVAVQDAIQKYDAQLEKYKDPLKAEQEAIRSYAFEDPAIKQEYDKVVASPAYMRINTLQNDLLRKVDAATSNTAATIPIKEFTKSVNDLIAQSPEIGNEKVKQQQIGLNNRMADFLETYTNKLVKDTIGTAANPSQLIDFQVDELATGMEDIIIKFQQDVSNDKTLSEGEKEVLLLHSSEMLQNTDEMYFAIDRVTDDLTKLNEGGRTEGKRFKKFLKKAAKFVVKRILPIALAVGVAYITGGAASFLVKAAMCTCIFQAIAAKVGFTFTKAAITSAAISIGKKVQSFMQGNIYCKLMKDCPECNPKAFGSSINACSVPPVILKGITIANKFFKLLGIDKTILTPGEYLVLGVDKFLNIGNLPHFANKLEISLSPTAVAAGMTISTAGKLASAATTIEINPANPASLQQKIELTAPKSVGQYAGYMKVTSLNGGRVVGEQDSVKLDITVSPAAALTLADGLVLYLPFEDNTQDASGKGNHGTPKGIVSYVTAKRGNGIKLRGVESPNWVNNPDFVLVKNSSSLTLGNIFSISYWVKIDGSRTRSDDCNNLVVNGYGGEVFSKGASSALYFKERQDFSAFYPYKGSVAGYGASQIASATQGFRHIIYTLSNNVLKLYVNGELIDVWRNPQPAINFAEANNYDISIGTSLNPGVCNGYWGQLNGVIDELRFYNRALTDAEVKLLFEQ